MKIIHLQVENFKRLKAIDITPEGSVVKITGKNAQGKSSVLDAIWGALGGGKALPTEPIRQGETQARIRVELDDLVVTRTFTPGNSYLKVETKDGASYKSPQAILDKLVGRLSFDPLQFAQADAKTQRAMLLEVTGLEVDREALEAAAGTYVQGDTPLDTLNATYKAVFDERALANRQAEQAKASLAAMPIVEPVAMVSVSELMVAYRAAEAQNRLADQQAHEYQGWRNQITELDQKIAGWEAQIAAARQSQITLRERVAAWQEPQRPDVVAIETALANAENTNARAQMYQNRKLQADRVDQLQAEAEAYTQRLDAVKTYQRDLVASAKFPIEGLGFANGGVTYHGVPFGQASSAEQLRVSLAMAMALNPELRVIRVENASLLDSEGLAILEEMAQGEDMQVWAEIVSDSGEIGIYIEDGAVVAPVLA